MLWIQQCSVIFMRTLLLHFGNMLITVTYALSNHWFNVMQNLLWEGYLTVLCVEIPSFIPFAWPTFQKLRAKTVLETDSYSKTDIIAPSKRFFSSLWDVSHSPGLSRITNMWKVQLEAKTKSFVGVGAKHRLNLLSFVDLVGFSGAQSHEAAPLGPGMKITFENVDWCRI